LYGRAIGHRRTKCRKEREGGERQKENEEERFPTVRRSAVKP